MPTALADNAAARGAAPAAKRWDVFQDGGAPGHGAAGSQPGAAAHRPAAAHPQLPRLPGSDEVKAGPGAPREPLGRAAGGEGRTAGRARPRREAGEVREAFPHAPPGRGSGERRWGPLPSAASAHPGRAAAARGGR